MSARVTNPLRLPLILMAALVIGGTVGLALIVPAANGAAASPPVPPAGMAVPPHAFAVEIANGRVKGDDTLKVRQGEQVEVRFSSDQPVVLHLHGYEVEAKVTPPGAALMSFKANLPGRFPVHEHRTGAGNHRALLFVEVHP
jgi:hypothetical protein